MATVKELRDLARQRNIKGFSTMKKADLQKALETPPPKPPRLKSKAEQAKNPVKQVQPPKKAPAKKAPVKKAPKPASLGAMRKELKDKGVKGTASMKKYELETRLAPRKPALIKKYSDTAFKNLQEFQDDAEDDFTEDLLKKNEKLLKELDLFLGARDGGMNANLTHRRGKAFDDVYKEKTMELIQKLDKAFKIDIVKGKEDFIG